MSVRGKDFRCELEAEAHEALRVMAEYQNKPLHILGAELLEKTIIGEFHAFTIIVKRLERSGILRTDSEKRGRGAD